MKKANKYKMSGEPEQENYWKTQPVSRVTAT